MNISFNAVMMFYIYSWAVAFCVLLTWLAFAAYRDNDRFTPAHYVMILAVSMVWPVFLIYLFWTWLFTEDRQRKLHSIIDWIVNIPVLLVSLIVGKKAK